MSYLCICHTAGLLHSNTTGTAIQVHHWSLCWITRASRTLLPQLSSLPWIFASCQLMVCAVFWTCMTILSLFLTAFLCSTIQTVSVLPVSPTSVRLCIPSTGRKQRSFVGGKLGKRRVLEDLVIQQRRPMINLDSGLILDSL